MQRFRQQFFRSLVTLGMHRRSPEKSRSITTAGPVIQSGSATTGLDPHCLASSAFRRDMSLVTQVNQAACKDLRGMSTNMVFPPIPDAL